MELPAAAAARAFVARRHDHALTHNWLEAKPIRALVINEQIADVEQRFEGCRRDDQPSRASFNDRGLSHFMDHAGHRAKLHRVLWIVGTNDLPLAIAIAADGG